MKLKRTLLIIFLTFFVFSSCGRKGPLTYPEGQKRPKFDKVVDE